MRIGYLIPEFPAQTHIFFWREICALRELGADLTLLSTRKPQSEGKHHFVHEAKKETVYLFPPKIITASLVLVMHPLWVIKSIFYILTLNETKLSQKLRLMGIILVATNLLDQARKRNLTHIHSHSCADAAHLLVIAALSKYFTYSLTLHGELALYGTDHKSKFANASFIAMVTYALQDKVANLYNIDKSRLPVIRMGVDVDKFLPTKKQKSDAVLKMITVARLSASKGHIFAMQAIKQIKERHPGITLQYTIVGDGELLGYLQEQVKALDLAAEVLLVGTAGEHDVIRYLEESDVFVLSSVGYEAAPVSVMEAMASGLVVVSSIIGGTPEMIDHEKDGFLFPQTDVDSLARIIERLVFNPEERMMIGRAARQKAQSHFSSREFARLFFDKISNEK